MYRLIIDGTVYGTDEDTVKPLIERLTYVMQCDDFQVVTLINLNPPAEPMIGVESNHV